MQAVQARPLCLHAFVTDSGRKAENLTRASADGRLRAIQGVAVAIGGWALGHRHSRVVEWVSVKPAPTPGSEDRR